MCSSSTSRAASRCARAISRRWSPAPGPGLYTNLITSGVTLDRAAARGAGRGRARSRPALLPGQRAADRADRIGGYQGRRREKARDGPCGALPPACPSPSTRSSTARTSTELAAMIGLAARARRAAHRGGACPVLRLGARQPRRADAEPGPARGGDRRRRAARRDGCAAGSSSTTSSPDYYARRPKPCMGGWGRTAVNVTPRGKVMPCHAAGNLAGLDFPSVRERSLRWIWQESARLPALPRHRLDGRALPLLRAPRRSTSAAAAARRWP